MKWVENKVISSEKLTKENNRQNDITAENKRKKLPWNLIDTFDTYSTLKTQFYT